VSRSLSKEVLVDLNYLKFQPGDLLGNCIAEVKTAFFGHVLYPLLLLTGGFAMPFNYGLNMVEPNSLLENISDEINIGNSKYELRRYHLFIIIILEK
jgi:hypothetical protein